MDAEVIDLTDSRPNSPAAAQDAPHPAAARLGVPNKGGDSDDDVIMMDVKPAPEIPNISAPAAHAPSSSTGNADFIPSPKYAGTKHGYSFSRGSMGLGYYNDAATKSSSLPNAGGASFRAAAAPPAVVASSSELYLSVPLGACSLRFVRLVTSVVKPSSRVWWLAGRSALGTPESVYENVPKGFALFCSMNTAIVCPVQLNPDPDPNPDLCTSTLCVHNAFAQSTPSYPPPYAPTSCQLTGPTCHHPVTAT